MPITVYEDGEIKAGFSEDVDEDFAEGRVTFSFKSNEGEIVIYQNERNKKIFIAYVSEDISQRLLRIFRDVETETLKLKRENQLSKYKYRVDDTKVSKNTQLGIGIKQLGEKDKGEL